VVWWQTFLVLMGMGVGLVLMVYSFRGLRDGTITTRNGRQLEGDAARRYAVPFLILGAIIVVAGVRVMFATGSM